MCSRAGSAADFVEKAFAIDDDAGHLADSNEAAVVVGRNRKGELTTLDLDQVGFGPNLAPHLGRVDVIELDLHANAGLVVGEAIAHGRHRCRLTKGQQSRGGQDRDIARALLKCGVGCADDVSDLSRRPSFGCHIGTINP